MSFVLSGLQLGKDLTFFSHFTYTWCATVWPSAKILVARNLFGFQPKVAPYIIVGLGGSVILALDLQSIVRELDWQGSDTRVHTPKKPGGFFGYTHLKNPFKKAFTQF